MIMGFVEWIFVVLIHHIDDLWQIEAQSKLGTKYSVRQIAFFKGIVSHACSYFCTLLIKVLCLLYKEFRLESKSSIHMCDLIYQYLDLSLATCFITLSAFSFLMLAMCALR